MAGINIRFDGMVWPNPNDPNEARYRLRRGVGSEEDQMFAARCIAAYAQLVYDPQRVRNDKIESIRRGATPTPGGGDEQ